MEILLCMRNQTVRTKNNSLFILNLFALQFISLIALNRLDDFYLKIAEFILILVDGKLSVSNTLILINFGFNLLIVSMFIFVMIIKNFKHRQSVIRFIGTVILNFKYIFLIPIGCVNVKPLVQPSVQVKLKICCAFNMVITFILSAIELYTNWSNRFIEKDYCNRRQNSILCLLFQFSFVFSSVVFGSLVGSLFLIAVSIFRAYQVSITVQYPLIQKSTFFYSSLNIYICIICLIGDKKLMFLDFTFKILIGIVVSLYFSKNACSFINTWYGNSKNLFKFNHINEESQKNQKQTIQSQHESKISSNYKDAIILSRILLSRSHTLQKQKYQQNEWNIWWQKYDILIVAHKLACTNDKCECRLGNEKDESNIIKQDMRKLMMKLEEKQKTVDIRIMGIYLNIQIANKPLKGYYQIIKMQVQDISVTNSIDLQCLLLQTRQCFNKIFVVNKIQNSGLPLMKIIRFQQLVEGLEFEIKSAFEANINFNQMFTMNSIKVTQIIVDSKKVFEIKQKINNRFQDLVTNYSDSLYVTFLIFIFYQYLQPYRSKQKQLKSISQQKNLKKRLFQKQQQNIFSLEYGVIYIDLVQQKGKIKKITKNICQIYGHNYEDMISFNINQFMPRIFGKSHHKFLTNFVELGKIKILAQKKRILFGKNKSKFIFPLQARLRTQHLLNDQFGVTALLRKEENGNGYIMFTANGRIQEISENLYKMVFNSSLKSEVDKTRRLCLLKMIPNLVYLINEGKLQQNSTTVYESLLIFSNYSDMSQKFRIYREPKAYSSTYNSNSNTASYLGGSLDIEQTSNQLSYRTSGLGQSYYAQLYKSFLNELNIVKLNAFAINYKLEKLRTQQFAVFLLQVISIQTVEDPYLSSIDQFKKIAQYLNIYQQHGSIGQNFDKFIKMLERNDVLNFMFNRNIQYDKKNYKESLRKKNHNGQRQTKKKMLTIGQDEQINQAASIPSNSALNNFDDMANGMLNQQEMQRGGSQRSSVTDQSQNQSKKQMLINAFNSESSGISSTFLFFLNVLVLIKFSILFLFFIKCILQIETMHSRQMNEIMNMNFKSLFQFRLASYEIRQFYEIWEDRGFNVSQINKNELSSTQTLINQQFTQCLLIIKRLNQKKMSLDQSQQRKQLQIYDNYLQKYLSMTILELINDLNFKFKQQTTQGAIQFYEINYLPIHEKLKENSQQLKQRMQSSNLQQSQKIIILVFGMYQILCVLVALAWIPILYLISGKQKRIINLLSTMNVKQLKRFTHKLRFIWQNLRMNKISQINYILSMLNDQKIQQSLDIEKQKNMVRNIRLVEEQGCYSVKPKIVAIIIIIFILLFSVMPFIFYMNLTLDSNKFIKTMNVIEQTNLLANKAPTLINVFLRNINNIYKNRTIKVFSQSIYQQTQTNYFDLTSYISKTQELSKDFINQNGTYQKFSQNICSSLECSMAEKEKDVRFYDHISLMRNIFTILQPEKLNIQSRIELSTLDSWVKETNLIQMLNWINKIYLFQRSWSKKFYHSIQATLNETQKRLIIIGSIIIPFYIVALIYLEYKLIKKMSGILRDAESVHMHFPVQILAENTYLTSYFNDKIKNNK